MNKEVLKNSIIAGAERVIEMVKELSVNRMNSNSEYAGPTQYPRKAELKAKMTELRRDTMRLDKLLRTYESKNK